MIANKSTNAKTTVTSNTPAPTSTPKITERLLIILQDRWEEEVRKKAVRMANMPSNCPSLQAEAEAMAEIGRDADIAKGDYYSAKAQYHLERQEWAEYCTAVTSDWNVLYWCFFWETYKELPVQYQYDLIVAAYTRWGDEMPSVRKAVYGLKKLGVPVILPDELAAQDVITVYRGCTDNIGWVRNAISWTTDIEVGKRFKTRQEILKGSEARLYRGKIRKKDILAYTSCREESEVIQHSRVYDIEDITDEAFSQDQDE